MFAVAAEGVDAMLYFFAFLACWCCLCSTFAGRLFRKIAALAKPALVLVNRRVDICLHLFLAMMEFFEGV
jgi:hypothetical protein